MKITVSDWKSYAGTGGLKGFFKITLEWLERGQVYGLIIKCSLFEQESGARWIGMPSKQWNKRNGTTAYEDQVDYIDPETEDFIHKEVLDRLDKIRNSEKPVAEDSPARGTTEPGTQLAPVITDDDIPF
jgi:hypothetical protein